MAKKLETLKLGFIFPPTEQFPIHTMDITKLNSAMLNIVTEFELTPYKFVHYYLSLNYDTSKCISLPLVSCIQSQFKDLEMITKKQFPSNYYDIFSTLKMYAVIPYLQRYKEWEQCTDEEYETLESYCSNKFFIVQEPCGDQQEKSSLLLKCNQEVIHKSDFIIALYDAKKIKDDIMEKSLQYAKENKKPISYIHPTSFKFSKCPALRKQLRYHS